MTQLFYNSRNLFDDPFEILYKTINDPFFTSLRSEKASSLVKYPYNIKNTEDEVQIEIAVLGLDKSDIDIKVEDDTLTVSTDKYNNDKECSSYIIRKIVQRNFSLSWKLDNILDLDKIGAVIDKGILHITIPVKEESKSTVKQIEIK